ncbi:phosphatase PAP2 family protein [Ornithinimicrobium sp. Y1847]|uniref:phosphatase PAP2 family protein n=1 Tax=Ornithinimicrobium sp. Y1847 TaxID=3405419 RepID=UPI003B66F167
MPDALTHRDLPPPVMPWSLITIGVMGVAALYVGFVLTTTGQAVDNAVMDRALHASFGNGYLAPLHHLMGPAVAVPMALVVSALGLVRGWRTGAGALAAVAVILALPQVLKAGLPRPQLADPWQMANSLPSGHVAAVAAVGIALLIVVPPLLSGIALLLTLAATGIMGVVVLGLGHHRPSDIAASLGVAMIGWGIGLLVQRGGATRIGRDAAAGDLDQRRPRRRPGSFGGHSPSSEPSSVA